MTGGSRPFQGGSPGRAAIAACLAVVLVLVILPVLWGATPGDSLLYAAYLAAFVLMPGVALTRVLEPSGGGSFLRLAAIGAGVGYLLGNFAFSLTAALDVRDAYWLYPVAVLGVWGGVEYARRGRSRPRLELPAARLSIGTTLVFVA